MLKFLLILIVGIFAFGGLNAQSLPPLEEQVMRDFMESKFQFEVEAIQSKVVKRVLKAELYSISEKSDLSENGSVSNYFVAKMNGEYHRLANASAILTFINPGFILTNEDEADDLCNVIKLFHSFSQRLKMYREGNNWYLETSSFFDDIEGYTISTNKRGSITAIHYGEIVKITQP